MVQIVLSSTFWGVVYRVYFFILRTLKANFNIENDNNFQWKLHGCEEEGCCFLSMFFFYNNSKNNVFYKLWHLEFLNHQVRARFYAWVISWVEMDSPLLNFSKLPISCVCLKSQLKRTVSCEHYNFSAKHGSEISDSSNFSSIPLLSNPAF